MQTRPVENRLHMKYVVFCSLWLPQILWCNEETTQQWDTESFQHLLRTRMSTKSQYPTPSSEEFAALIAQDNTINNPSQQCKVIHTNFVIRHGTRFPTKKAIKKILTVHKLLVEILHSSQSPTPFDWLLSWTPPYTTENEGTLAPIGEAEMSALGTRIRNRFFNPNVPTASDNNQATFEHTWKVRTEQSAKAFASVFISDPPINIEYRANRAGEDQVLRFYDNCPALDAQFATETSSTRHYNEYRHSSQMEANLHHFQELFGPQGQLLTQHHLEAAYDACAFDVALLKEYLQWCQIFRSNGPEMLLSMDFFQDLKHFYRKSYGTPLAYEIASPLLRQMITEMRNRTIGVSDVGASFKFAHAETILPLAALMDISYSDRHKTDSENHFVGSVPLEVAETRHFKGASLAPFSANIGFVLYECTQKGSEEGDRAAGKVFQVKTLYNERVVRFPACGKEDVCTMEQLENLFYRWIYEFDSSQVCEVPVTN
uniref:Multiple inositol polyphosphate phosphatase 1 n=1 Tax=Albugo laibachii Nc14 TaxID=890382 RepID=F0W252_9STRA|nr:multiple inositol polyphosphate phosphatase 1 putati [Albugo laibachii Nc14]|eukprot:CCA15134.1 multiple inositol polyphosphate phosphatase 1 putati [Albugo laibachii Nc14]